MIEVHALHELMRGEIGVAGLLVGDCLAPKDGGWQQGQPGVNVFRPYVVLMQGPSRPIAPDRITPDHSEWNVDFSLRSYGGSIDQVRATAHSARTSIEDLRAVFGVTDVFKIVHTHFDQLGSVVRDDSVQPPYWQVFDAIRVEVSRSRNQP